MKLNRESAYGIEGLLVLATMPAGTQMLLSDIAVSRGLPQSFLAKIFQKLAHQGLVRSFRGATRGYALARPAGEIKLGEILLATEGPDFLKRCVFWSRYCADTNPCPLHNSWKEVKDQIIERLMTHTTLADLVKRQSSQGDAVEITSYVV
jgi:Rrf2 family protein